MREGALQLIIPDWPLPAAVRACTTTRSGGRSAPPFDSLNLGDHVDDDPRAVAANRVRLRAELDLPGEPLWLRQVHGTDVALAGHTAEPAVADAAVALEPGAVCAVLTADCLPVLFASRDGRRVAAAHAGWRGLAAGVLEAVVQRLGVPAAELLAWLGPAIGPARYEVGEEVFAAFRPVPGATAAFRPSGAGHWYADLYALARLRLRRLGLAGVYGGAHCTFDEPERFFSYRREGRTGRMASLIWIRP